MTELEFSDAGDDLGGADGFDNSELVQWASHGHHAGPADPSDQMSIAEAEGDPSAYGEWIADVEQPVPSEVDESVGYRDEGQPPDDAGQSSAARGDGQSSNWIRVDSRWHPSDVDPNVSD
jgi:hypothetical protein